MGNRFVARFLAMMLPCMSVGFCNTTSADPSQSDQPPKSRCLFVSSYHVGYAHSDAIAQGLYSVLEDHCEIRQFDMDTKRQKSQKSVGASVQRALSIIDKWMPDVVIVADDNAVKYLLEPNFKDSDIPFVFCGVNWSADEYGLPYKNATGIVEVAPVEDVLTKAKNYNDTIRKAFYVGALTLSEGKNLKRFQEVGATLGVEVVGRLVDGFDAWIEAYQEGQGSDLIIVGSKAGITDWDHHRAVDKLSSLTDRFSVTVHEWMMPYAAFGATQVSEEQGEWAGKVAIEILNGVMPDTIPIVANRRWDYWINRDLLSASGQSLPHRVSDRAKEYADTE